jgi:probable metal-binding protein
MNHPDIPSIHGHEVLDFIAESRQALAQSEWVAAIEAEFGPDARYHTCSAENLSAAGLVEFLVARGKLAGDATALALDASQICHH